jgi:hypothetical protein
VYVHRRRIRHSMPKKPQLDPTTVAAGGLACTLAALAGYVMIKNYQGGLSSVRKPNADSAQERLSKNIQNSVGRLFNLRIHYGVAKDEKEQRRVGKNIIRLSGMSVVMQMWVMYMNFQDLASFEQMKALLLDLIRYVMNPLASMAPTMDTNCLLKPLNHLDPFPETFEDFSTHCNLQQYSETKPSFRRLLECVASSTTVIVDETEICNMLAQEYAEVLRAMEVT